MPVIVTTSTSTDLEELVLDGLSLNSAELGLAEVAFPVPRQRREWIGAADSEWQALVRNPLHENREITARIQVTPTVDMDGALGKIGEILDKLQAASQSQDGIELVWSPAESTVSVTFDVLAGEITDLPVDWASGWLVKAPSVTIVMTAKPYWRGEETLTSTASSSSPFVTMEIANLAGDIPALGRLIVTDTATQSRRHVEWGLEGPLTYDASTSLLLDSDSLVTSGFAGTGNTRTGAYDPNASGNSVIRAAMPLNTPTAVCGTGNQSHIGTFRVKARVWADGSERVRFSYQAGDGPYASGAWVTPPSLSTANWVELDLGTITVAPVVSGTQRWQGRVEAYDTVDATSSIDVDYLVLVPVTDGYGKARAQYSYKPGVIVGSDDFTSTTAGNALNARVAPSGGTWATSGVATDFVFSDPVLSAFPDEFVTRTTTSDASRRFAVLGSSNYTDTEVSARATLIVPTSSERTGGVIARWVDSSNYVAAYYRMINTAGISSKVFIVEKVVAGVTTELGTTGTIVASNSGVVLRLLAFTDGTWVGQWLAWSISTGLGAVLFELSGRDSSLATGGALDDGKPGLFDRMVTYGGAGSTAGRYDVMRVAVPEPAPTAIYSGRNLQIRYDDTIRQDSTGTYTGRPQSYRGSRFLVPVGTSRVLAKARRNDIETTADDNVTDSTQVQVAVTPRGLAVPRP